MSIKFASTSSIDVDVQCSATISLEHCGQCWRSTHNCEEAALPHRPRRKLPTACVHVSSFGFCVGVLSVCLLVPFAVIRYSFWFPMSISYYDVPFVSWFSYVYPRVLSFIFTCCLLMPSRLISARIARPLDGDTASSGHAATSKLLPCYPHFPLTVCSRRVNRRIYMKLAVCPESLTSCEPAKFKSILEI